MMAGIITVPLHIGDFIGGTMHMDTLEKGAYLMLLLAHYQAGHTGLPDDDKKLARIAGVTPKVWQRIRETMAEKFVIQNGFWVSNKVTDVIRRVELYSSSQRDKALKKHNPVLPVQNTGDANQNQSQISNTSVLDSPHSPRPKLEKHDRSKPKRIISPDWKPTEDDCAFAAELGFKNIDTITGEFVDYWRGRGEARADWSATFRNLLRKKLEWGAKDGKRTSGGGRQDSAATQLWEQAFGPVPSDRC